MSHHKKGVPGGSPYPVQAQASYPTAPPAYDAMASAPFTQQAGVPGGSWNEPPPPYSAAPGYPPQSGYQPQSGYPPKAGYMPPAGYMPQAGYPPQASYQQALAGIPIGPGTQVHIQGAFNAGARFDGHAQPRIPPPPPGVAPNAAQLAAMSGATVVTSQKQSSKWVSGAGGGTVFW